MLEAELISQQYSLKEVALNLCNRNATIAKLQNGIDISLRRLSSQRWFERVGQGIRYLKLAVSEDNNLAQLSLGVWLTKVDSRIVVVPPHPKRASFEPAID